MNMSPLPPIIELATALILKARSLTLKEWRFNLLFELPLNINAVFEWLEGE
jgi:hypothetical protein